MKVLERLAHVHLKFITTAEMLALLSSNGISSMGCFSHEMVIIRMESRSSTRKAPSWSLFHFIGGCKCGKIKSG